MKKIFLIVFLLIGLMPLCLSADESGLLDIKTIPQVNFKINSTVIGEYSGHGRIDEIFTNRIVINDSNFYLSSKLKIIDAKGHNYSGPLSQGMYAYYFLDKNNKINKIVINTDE